MLVSLASSWKVPDLRLIRRRTNNMESSGETEKQEEIKALISRSAREIFEPMGKEFLQQFSLGMNSQLKDLIGSQLRDVLGSISGNKGTTTTTLPAEARDYCESDTSEAAAESLEGYKKEEGEGGRQQARRISKEKDDGVHEGIIDTLTNLLERYGGEELPESSALFAERKKRQSGRVAPQSKDKKKKNDREGRKKKEKAAASSSSSSRRKQKHGVSRRSRRTEEEEEDSSSSSSSESSSSSSTSSSSGSNNGSSSSSSGYDSSSSGASSGSSSSSSYYGGRRKKDDSSSSSEEDSEASRKKSRIRRRDARRRKSTKRSSTGGSRRKQSSKNVFDRLRAKIENGGKNVPFWFGCNDDLQLALMARAKRDGASFILKSSLVKRVSKGVFGDRENGVALEHLYVPKKDLARLDTTAAEEHELVLKSQEGGGTILRPKETKIEIRAVRDASDLRTRLKNMGVLLRASYPENDQARKEVVKLMEAVELCNTQHFEERIPIKIVQFLADEANACLRDWFDAIAEAAATARERMMRKEAESPRHFSTKKYIRDKRLQCPKLTFKKIYSYFKDGAELRNLIRLFGGGDISDSHGGGGGIAAIPGGDEKKAGGGGAGAALGAANKSQLSALKQIFFDEKSKKFYCFEHLQGRSCDAKKCNFYHDDGLSPAKKDVLLKALKALKAVQGGAKPLPSK